MPLNPLNIIAALRSRAPTDALPSVAEVLALLRAQDAQRDALYAASDKARHDQVGDDVHLRGIIEFSNYCDNDCAYCGIRRHNQELTRYRMPIEEIVEQAARARTWGCPTVVLQSGEDAWFTVERLADLIRRVRATGIEAVTLSVGVRSLDALRQLKAAGCDRYLLRFETSNRTLFARIHPDESFAQRIQFLKDVRSVGIQVGSGFMIGLPGPLTTLARDILFATSLDLDMIGCGPFLAVPKTPLAGAEPLQDREIYLKAIAILRLLNPQANIPATTAFDALMPDGRDRVLQVGANVFMPNVTPAKYRRMYQLYPNKPCVDEEGAACAICVRGRLARLGRPAGRGPGHSLRHVQGA